MLQERGAGSGGCHACYRGVVSYNFGYYFLLDSPVPQLIALDVHIDKKSPHFIHVFLTFPRLQDTPKPTLGNDLDLRSPQLRMEL